MKNYSIWVKLEDDNTFDINVWDEDNNERVDDLEACYIPSYSVALDKLEEVIKQNKDINFIRLEDKV